jgi:hypothetical protein
MFVGGILGIAIGAVILYAIYNDIKNMGTELGEQRVEIIRLTNLVRTLDTHLAKVEGKSKQVNDHRNYIAIIDRGKHFDENFDN